MRTGMDPFAPLFDILRPGHEHLKIALECHALPPTAASHSSALSQPPTNDPDAHANRRILAVVSNVEAGHEEVCLLVLKRRRKDPHRVKAVDGLPILPAVKVDIAPYDLNSDCRQEASTSEARGSTWQKITISLAGQSVSCVSDDEQGVKDLVSVLRDAVASSQMPALNTDADEDAHTPASYGTATTGRSPRNASAPVSHAWMSHYVDAGRAMGVAAGAPIFSRFTTSSIHPPASDRPAAPSPSTDEIKISFGTWNVNGMLPTPDVALSQWLHIVEDDPDVIVVGLEEADSSGLSYVVWTPHVEAAWATAIETAMGRQVSEYEKLASRQLVGVLMLVYIKRPIRSRLTNVAHAAVGVGFGGWAANKGAAALRFELDESTSFCFVVSHLSAFDGQEALERRRWDYREIVRRLRLPLVPHDKWLATEFVDDSDFDAENSDSSLSSKGDGAADIGGPIHSKQATEGHHMRGHHLPSRFRRKLTSRFNGDADIIVSGPNSSLETEEKQSATLDAESMLRAQLRKDTALSDPRTTEGTPLRSHDVHILQHDVVFWGGDLNFRVDLSTSETKRLVPKQQYEETLLKFDQLRNELNGNTSFEGFHEQRIMFAPTYKYDRGTDTYDTSEKQRCPSWTDRVLWRELAHLETDGVGKRDERQQDTKEKNPSAGTEGRPRKRVTPIAYESCQSLRISDHKPVLATFLVHTGKSPFSET